MEPVGPIGRGWPLFSTVPVTVTTLGPQPVRINAQATPSNHPANLRDLIEQVLSFFSAELIVAHDNAIVTATKRLPGGLGNGVWYETHSAVRKAGLYSARMQAARLR